MHKKFDSTALEKKWQEKWQLERLYDVGARDQDKEKEYILVEWPYPSGNLHIGHWYAFAVPDIYVRFRRMTGKQVLFPMGFDAFGLPAENAAIKRNINPKDWTNDNIAHMKKQLESMGNAFSWDKTTSSTDPEYYKWTQWMFTKFFEKGLAYRGKGVVNWCPGCNTVIANEQVLSDGTCERSGDAIVKREMPQWMLRITDYADRLIDDLDDLNWPEHIKEAQRQWIGRSRGAEIDFRLSTGDSVTVFTTRADTLYGATFLVLAPEHPLVKRNREVIKNWTAVDAYITSISQKDEQERLDNTKEKTGVRLEGVTATNPASGEVIPVFVADYVLASYGTGAIMAVPAHDERDFAFARAFSLPIKSVITPHRITHAGALLELKSQPGTFVFQLRDQNAPNLPNQISFFGGGLEANEDIATALKRELNEELELNVTLDQATEAYSYQGSISSHHVWIGKIAIDDVPQHCHEGSIIVLSLAEAIAHPQINYKIRDFLIEYFQNGKPESASGILMCSGEFDGMDSQTAKEAIVKKVGGRTTNTYRLRDWSIGRQRYWGVPIPIVYAPDGKAHPVPLERLPWLLPEDVDFKPTGEAPLAQSEALRKRTEEIFGQGWTPEVETMDTFVDSSWYFLRYLDAHNDTELASEASQHEWMPVDIYFGGAEHTTMHLLYSRFWHKALFDLGLANTNEPYRRRINRGLILGPDGNKMSKSKGNVIDPDEQVRNVGADTVKMYLAFMGPYEGSNYPWDMGGIAGLRRFLERVYGISDHFADSEPESVTRLLHKTIKKVGEDIEHFKFNTAISSMMIFINEVERNKITSESYRKFIKILAPFAPHLAEEVWQSLGEKKSVHLEDWPSYDKVLATGGTVTIGVQINGKLRGSIDLSTDASEEEAIKEAHKESAISARLKEGVVTKIIYVPGRILNFIHTKPS